MAGPNLNDNAIRKAAILFRSLEPESAAALLAQLSQAEARAVRDAVRALGEVSDDERAMVASEVRSQTAKPAVEHAAGVELEITASTVAPEVERIPSDDGYQAQPASGLATADRLAPSRDASHPFAALPELERTDPATLAAYLDRENAGVVAVVLSYLPPNRAAAVLDELRFELRAEAVERLANLGESDAEALQVLAADLADWIKNRQEVQLRRADRLATINAILDAATPTSRDDLVQRLRDRGCNWLGVVQTPATPSHNELAKPQAEPTDDDHVDSLQASFPQTELPQPKLPRPVPATPEPAPAPATKPLSVPFDALCRLNPKLLSEVVKRVPPRQVLLALAGADEALQKRIESLIPAKQARELRRRIESLGPTSLREVDAAQLAMATAASELWDFFQGKRVG